MRETVERAIREAVLAFRDKRSLPGTSRSHTAYRRFLKGIDYRLTGRMHKTKSGRRTSNADLNGRSTGSTRKEREKMDKGIDWEGRFCRGSTHGKWATIRPCL